MSQDLGIIIGLRDNICIRVAEQISFSYVLFLPRRDDAVQVDHLGLLPKHDDRVVSRHHARPPGYGPGGLGVGHHKVPLLKDLRDDRLEHQRGIKPPGANVFLHVSQNVCFCEISAYNTYHAVFPRPHIGHSVVAVVKVLGTWSGTSWVVLPAWVKTLLARTKRKPSNWAGCV